MYILSVSLLIDVCLIWVFQAAGSDQGAVVRLLHKEKKLSKSDLIIQPLIQCLNEPELKFQLTSAQLAVQPLPASISVF